MRTFVYQKILINLEFIDLDVDKTTCPHLEITKRIHFQRLRLTVTEGHQGLQHGINLAFVQAIIRFWYKKAAPIDGCCLNPDEQTFLFFPYPCYPDTA